MLLCLLLAAVAAAGTYYFSVTRGVRLDASKFEPAAASMSIYDKNDAPVATVARGSAKKSVLLTDLPEYVPQAFIAAEDKHFYSHHGLDYKGMARAALKNMKAGAFNKGLRRSVNNLSKIRSFHQSARSAASCRRSNSRGSWSAAIQRTRSWNCT